MKKINKNNFLLFLSFIALVGYIYINVLPICKQQMKKKPKYFFSSNIIDLFLRFLYKCSQTFGYYYALVQKGFVLNYCFYSGLVSLTVYAFYQHELIYSIEYSVIFLVNLKNNLISYIVHKYQAIPANITEDMIRAWGENIDQRLYQGNRYSTAVTLQIPSHFPPVPEKTPFEGIAPIGEKDRYGYFPQGAQDEYAQMLGFSDQNKDAKWKFFWLVDRHVQLTELIVDCVKTNDNVKLAGALQESIEISSQIKSLHPVIRQLWIDHVILYTNDELNSFYELPKKDQKFLLKMLKSQF